MLAAGGGSVWTLIEGYIIGVWLGASQVCPEAGGCQ